MPRRQEENDEDDEEFSYGTLNARAARQRRPPWENTPTRSPHAAPRRMVRGLHRECSDCRIHFLLTRSRLTTIGRCKAAHAIARNGSTRKPRRRSRSGAAICALEQWRSPLRMPSREKKRVRDISPTNVKTLHANERAVGKVQPRPFSRAGNSTRINAFVNTLGRRNQAKRDAR